MQNTNSRFIVNIVPLQNVVSNTSGLDATAQLSNAVGNIQQMINFEQKAVYTNYISAYTQGNSIEVLSPLNLCNVGITSNNTPYAGSGTTCNITCNVYSNAILSPSGNTFIRLYDTSFASSPAISMGVSNHQVFQIGGTGNGLFYDATLGAKEFRVSSMIFAADFASISTVVVGGTCYAQNFVTLSDETTKYDVQALLDMSSITEKFKNINPYSFKYLEKDTKEIGLLAQELEAEFPECIDADSEKKYVKYNSVVALLLGAVRSLNERVKALESGPNGGRV
jgi:Chaperone of endosialidase